MRERIKHIIQSEGLSNLQFAGEISISPAAVTHILSGRNNPSLDIVVKIAHKYPKYSLRWLVLGELPILATDAHDSQNMLVSENSAPDNNYSSLSQATGDTLADNRLPFDAPEQSARIDITTAPNSNQTSQTPPEAEHDATQAAHQPRLETDQPTVPSQATADITKLIICFPDNTFTEYIRR